MKYKCIRQVKKVKIFKTQNAGGYRFINASMALKLRIRKVISKVLIY